MFQLGYQKWSQNRPNMDPKSMKNPYGKPPEKQTDFSSIFIDFGSDFTSQEGPKIPQKFKKNRKNGAWGLQASPAAPRRPLEASKAALGPSQMLSWRPPKLAPHPFFRSNLFILQHIMQAFFSSNLLGVWTCRQRSLEKNCVLLMSLTSLI